MQPVVPDAIFPGDKYGIPILDLQMQAEYIVPPIKMWGQQARLRAFNGTVGFYISDYKFNGTWSRPNSLPLTGCAVALEVNFSTAEEMPEAVAIYRTFQKRWLARYWQTCGVRIIADLNVDERHADLNMAGIPAGWQSYATRAHRGLNGNIPAMYERARERAGCAPKLFLVVGGGKDVESMSRDNGWLWIPEQMNQYKEHGNG